MKDMMLEQNKLNKLLEQARKSNTASDWDAVEEYSAYLSKKDSRSALECLCEENPSRQECLIYDL